MGYARKSSKAGLLNFFVNFLRRSKIIHFKKTSERA